MDALPGMGVIWFLGFCLSAGNGGIFLLVSRESKGGAGLNGWAIGLVVFPLFTLLDVLNEVEVGRLELVDTGLGLTMATDCSGSELLGNSGVCPVLLVDSGLGLVCGFGASIGLILFFFSTANGFGVSRGLGAGTGFLGSGVMICDCVIDGLVLLESVRGLK